MGRSEPRRCGEMADEGVRTAEDRTGGSGGTGTGRRRWSLRTDNGDPWLATRRGKLRVGGMLIILATLTALAESIIMLRYIFTHESIYDVLEDHRLWPFLVLESATIAISVVALAGGVSTIRRRRWRLSVLGGAMAAIAVIIPGLLIMVAPPLGALVAFSMFFGAVLGTCRVRAFRGEFTDGADTAGRDGPADDLAARARD